MATARFPVFMVFLLVAWASPARAQTSVITTYAGPALPTSGSRALNETIGVPQAVAADGAGGFYIASNQNRVYHVSAGGILTILAGTGTVGFSGDNGAAPSAQFNYIQGVAADRAGNVYISDSKNSRIRKISPAGVITTFAGTGAFGPGGDGGPAVSARLSAPRGLAVDRTGNLFIADAGNNAIRMVTPAGIITTIAGTSAQLNNPVAVAVDGSGNVLIADQHNNRIRMVTAGGVIETLAGTVSGFGGDGGPAAASRLSGPTGVTVDSAGNVWIADTGNNRIRVVAPDHIISTAAGTGTGGFTGDGGPAVSAQLATPIDVSADAAGNVFIADQGNYRIRRVDPARVIDSMAGMSDDGGRAMAAQLFFPNSIAADAAGNVYIADTDIHRIRKITPDGTDMIVAGNGTGGFSGDGGSAASAQLHYPAGVTVDSTGNLFIADTANQRIRKVTPGGIITTVAGTGGGGGGDGGPAVAAQIIDPGGVAVDGMGNLFIAETGASRIRKVDASGVIRTIAGDQLAFPAAVAADAGGNVYIADSVNNQIRLITRAGIIKTIAGNGKSGFAGDGGPATEGEISYPQAISLDNAGNLYIADTGNQRIRKVTPAGLISTVAGTGAYAFSGDGGSASAAAITSPYGVAAAGVNSFLISDTFSNRIRQVISTSIPYSLTGGAGVSFVSAGNSASIRTGYARIDTAGASVAPAALAIFGYRSGNVLISETGVPATNALTSGRLYAVVNGPVNTGVAIANPNAQAATIQFSYTDAGGNSAGSGEFTIAPDGQVAKFLNADPLKTFAGDTFEGTLSFKSDVPVGAIAIRGFLNERGEFLMSTLPVIDTAAPAPASAVTVPHFASGGGWSTQIILVNTGDTVLTGNVEFRAADGSLAAVSMGGQKTAIFSYSVAPRSFQKFEPDGAEAAPITGSIRILADNGDQAPSALVIFTSRPGAITVTQAGVPATTADAVRIYVESSANTESGIAIANTAADPVDISLELLNLDGSAAGLPAPVSRQLPGLGRVSELLSEIFPGAPASFRGLLRVSAQSAPLSVIGLRGRSNERGDYLITTTPPAPETLPADSTKLLIPHIPDGGGFTTQLILYSRMPQQSPQGSIVLVEQSGQPFAEVFR